jgi:hypothetical protein
MIMATKLTRLTHKIAIQLYLVAENCTIRSSRSRQPVRRRISNVQIHITFKMMANESLEKVNVKVKLSLCFTKHHAIKRHSGVEV